MLKNRFFYILILIFGVALIGFSFFFNGEDYKIISGIFIGVGAGLSGVSITNIITRTIELKNPKIMKQNEINLKDERNTAIRYKAKAKAGDITQWLVIGVAYITICISASLWVTLSVIGVFMFYHILTLYFIGKYGKEM